MNFEQKERETEADIIKIIADQETEIIHESKVSSIPYIGFYPLICILVDVIIIYSSYDWIVSKMNIGFSKLPFIILASGFVVLIEVILGASDAKNKLYSMVTFLMPSFALIELFLRQSQYHSAGLPSNFQNQETLMIVFLFLLSLFMHRVLFKEANSFVKYWNKRF